MKEEKAFIQLFGTNYDVLKGVLWYEGFMFFKTGILMSSSLSSFIARAFLFSECM